MRTYPLSLLLGLLGLMTTAQAGVKSISLGASGVL